MVIDRELFVDHDEQAMHRETMAKTLLACPSQKCKPGVPKRRWVFWGKSRIAQSQKLGVSHEIALAEWKHIKVLDQGCR